MKKLLAMLLALMMFQLPVASMAENFDDLGEMIGGADLETSAEVIGGADGPTSMFVTTSTGSAQGLGGAALAAGRRINTVMSIKELKGVQTGDAAIDAAINDLIAALGIAFFHQGDEGGMAVQLSGQDVLTLGGAVSGEDFYLNSNLLGGTVVVNVQEIEPLIGRFLDMFVLMETMTAREAEEIKEILAQAFDEMEASMDASMDSMMAKHDLENLNFSALEKVLTVVMDNIEYVEAPVLPKMCDVAEGGIALSISNDEFVDILRACLDFVNDNPVLKEYMAATGDFYTEEEVQEMWAFYQESGLNETEEEFRSRHMTVDYALKEARESLNGAKLLDGEFTFALYVNEDGEPVYGVMNLPMYDGRQTEVLEIVYTRQTVAAGVAHVCNITVDGETATIDALVTEANTVINFTDVEGFKAMDITITSVGEDALRVELNAYEYVDDLLFHALLEGEWEFIDVRKYLTGKLTMTDHDVAARPVTIMMAVNADYAIDGVDFSGATELTFDYEELWATGSESFLSEVAGITLHIASATADAEESIMAGSMTRPAELDDTAFQTWFVGLVNGLTSVLSTALTALPESVLMLLFSSGMI